jgi:hypothetical protein
MRRTAVIILICAFGLLVAPATTVHAQADARKAQVQAAENDAIESIRRDVLSAKLSADMTVGDFLDRADRHDALNDVFKAATQIGGTRWIDDHSCIIRFELDGRRVAAQLIDIAKSLGKNSPLPPETVSQAVKGWERRTFSATGTSSSAQYIVDVRPGDANPAWRSVPDIQSREAVSAAKSDAVRRVLESLRAIPMGEGKTVADALEVPSVKTAMQDWLGKQPVVGVEFSDDLEVRMTIAAPADDMWGVFKSAVSAQQQVPTPTTEAQWSRLHDDVTQRVARAVGRSYVPQDLVRRAAAAAGNPPAAGAPMVLPDRAPAWVFDTLDAEGSAAGSGKSLKTARMAEDDAVNKLRQQLYALRLDERLTLGDAAKKDPKVEEAVSRSLLRARTYRVARRDDGVTVRMTFDPRELWDELRMNH